MQTNDATGCGTVISIHLIGDCASFNWHFRVHSDAASLGLPHDRF